MGVNDLCNSYLVSCVPVVGTGLLLVAPLVPGTGVDGLSGLPSLVPGPVAPFGPSRSGRVPADPAVDSTVLLACVVSRFGGNVPPPA